MTYPLPDQVSGDFTQQMFRQGAAQPGEAAQLE
jgi:hypothetical protein